MPESRMRIAFFSLILLGTLWAAGCVPSARLTSTWTKPGLSVKPFRDLVVFGVAAKPTVRRAFEESFVADLRSRGVKARAGSALLDGLGPGDVRAVQQAIERSGADGVIMTHLVGERSEAVHVPTSHYTKPELYGSLYPYYQRVYSTVTTPGYYANYPLLQLETSLFETRGQTLVWSARTQTMDPAADKPTVNEVVAAVIGGMAQAGFLPP